MTVIFGTVASANANKSFAPCFIIPLYSWEVPGKKPGTSTKVIIGILKQSQKRTNLAAFLAELLSKQPANTIGWLATIPTGDPVILANPVIILAA